jgi:pyrroline-5-carboxylate reductase
MTTIGFLGAGNMGEALARGMIKGEIAAPGDVYLYDVAAERVKQLCDELGMQAAATPAELVAATETVVFAVKPQNMPDLLADLAAAPDAGSWTASKRWVSICAGTTTQQIENGLVPKPQNEDESSAAARIARVVRVMPNTPALVGLGAAGVARGSAAREADEAFVLKMMQAVGVAYAVDEAQMDAVTALSGSGPAYVFYLIESLQAAGEAVGLSAETARALSLQTVLGAATLASQQSDVPTEELRRRVTSPGGTTAAGLAMLEEQGFQQIVRECVEAATRRGKELADLSD